MTPCGNKKGYNPYVACGKFEEVIDKHISKKKEQEIYRDALINFGETHQIIKTIEELSELIQGLAKYITPNEYTIIGELKTNIINKLADVIITTNQLKLILEQKELQKKINEKLNRFARRLALRNKD